MRPTSALLAMVLFGNSWLTVVLVGCSGSQVQQSGSNASGRPALQPPQLGEKQLDPLLTTVSQLHVTTQESLEAAMMVGTPDGELIEARQYLASAEQALQKGKASYAARQYRESWEQLHAADTAFQQSEESAVRAGLGQLERELAADYGRLLPTGSGRPRLLGRVRVSQGNIHLHDGAGAGFQIVGKAQLGDTLRLLAESGEWYRVRTTKGQVGWVSKGLVTPLPTP